MGNMNQANTLRQQGIGQQIQGLGSIVNSQTAAYNASQNQSDPMASILGTGLGLVASKIPWSDIRLKENIKRIGTYENGLPKYEFSYKGCPQRYRGVMAQDVLEVMPDAVVANGEGYMAVRYDMLGIDMEKVQ